MKILSAVLAWFGVLPRGVPLALHVRLVAGLVGPWGRP